MTENKGLEYDPIPEERIYIEPEDYFPKETRKKYGLGEYAKKQAGSDIKDNNSNE